MRCLASAVRWAASWSLALGLALTPWAMAQAEDEKSPGKLEDVVVRGDAAMQGLEATSATVLDNSNLVDRIFVTPLDLFKLSPGVTISQYRQGGTPPAVQLRGFTTVSHGRDGAFFLDGVPLNDLDYGDTNMIIPEEIERVDLVKGPASTYAGNFASAGSFYYHPFRAGDFTRVKLQYGSFNTEDAVAVIARRDGNVDHVYAGELFHSDGYQNNSGWDKQIGAARWTYHVSDRLDLGLGVRAFHSTWDSPGYIPEKLYNANPSQAINDTNGGWKKWEMVQGDAAYKLSSTSSFKFNTWFNAEEKTRWYQNWVSSSQKTGSNYGNESFIQREAFGSGLAYNYQAKVLERDTTFTLGVNWMKESQSYEYWNLLVGSGRNRGSKYQDDDVDIYTTSLYGELTYRLFKPLRLVLGSRYDMLNGSLYRKLTNTTYDRDGTNVYSPKLGLVYALYDGWDLFANYSKGFALPGVTDYMTRSYLDPAIRTQYETGIHAKPNKWSDYGLTFWRLDTSDDFQVSQDDPTLYENAGETRREGIEAEANFYMCKHLRLRVDYAYIQTEYLNYFDGTTRRDGNELPNVPHNVFNVEISWQPPEGWGARLNYRYITEWYVDAANIVEADAWDLVNAQVSYRFNKRYKLALDAINLLDQKYSEYAGYTNGSKTYAPADPLSFYLTLTIDW